MPVLILVPVTLVVLCAFLAGLAWYEERLLSPRSLILYCARCRGTLPEHAEELVSAQSARLLAAFQRETESEMKGAPEAQPEPEMMPLPAAIEQLPAS